MSNRFRLIEIAGYAQGRRLPYAGSGRFTLPATSEVRSGAGQLQNAIFIRPLTVQIETTSAFPRQDSVIEGKRAIGPERSLDLLVELIGIADLADAAHDYLGRRPNFVPRPVYVSLCSANCPKVLAFHARALIQSQQALAVCSVSKQRR